jgi:hypothetical protein
VSARISFFSLIVFGGTEVPIVYILLCCLIVFGGTEVPIVYILLCCPSEDSL